MEVEQIKRTVNGKKVSKEDMSKTAKKIKNHTYHNEKDHLLYFGCGSGMLASNFPSSISQYT